MPLSLYEHLVQSKVSIIYLRDLSITSCKYFVWFEIAREVSPGPYFSSATRGNQGCGGTGDTTKLLVLWGGTRLNRVFN